MALQPKLDSFSMSSWFYSRKAFLAASLLAACQPAWAAPPTVSDAMRAIPASPLNTPKDKTIPDFMGKEDLESLGESKGDAITVRSFRFKGNQAVDKSALESLVKLFEGRALTLGQMNAIAARITRHYRDQGYPLARAMLPAQEVRDGVVTIEVIEGHYGKLTLNNQSLVEDDVLTGMLDTIRADEVVSKQSLERGLLMMNDMPGVKVDQVDMSAGEAPGTTDFSVATQATNRVAGFTTLDNHGSHHTGQYRATAGMEVRSPFGIGDKFSASGLQTESAHIKNYRVAYEMPLTDTGLRVEIATSKTSYSLGGDFASLDALGDARTYEAAVSYPFVRTRSDSLEGTLGIAQRDLTDEVRSTNTVTPKRSELVTAAVASTSYAPWFGIAGQTTANLSATFGHLDIRDAAARTLDAAGADTQGGYGKINVRANRSLLLSERWFFNAGLRAQHALLGKNLDGSEDMSIAGITGVKAYPVDEFVAENAVLLSADLRYAVLTGDPLHMHVGPFADFGSARMQNDVGATPARSLSGAGVGLYSQYESAFVNVLLAQQLSSAATSESTGRTKLLLQVGATF